MYECIHRCRYGACVHQGLKFLAYGCGAASKFWLGHVRQDSPDGKRKQSRNRIVLRLDTGIHVKYAYLDTDSRQPRGFGSLNPVHRMVDAAFPTDT